MTDSITADIVATAQETGDSASGHWTRKSSLKADQEWSVPRIRKISAMVFSLITADVAAPVLREPVGGMYQIVTTYQQTGRRAVGRRITWTEALLIARRALDEAEAARTELTRLEAARGIMWEEEE